MRVISKRIAFAAIVDSGCVQSLLVALTIRAFVLQIRQVLIFFQGCRVTVNVLSPVVASWLINGVIVYILCLIVQLLPASLLELVELVILSGTELLYFILFFLERNKQTQVLVQNLMATD